MAERIRHDAATTASGRILHWLMMHPYADLVERLSQLDAIVLEAIYESENGLADDPLTIVLCTSCFAMLRVRKGVTGNKEECPRCGHRMRLPEVAMSN